MTHNLSPYEPPSIPRREVREFKRSVARMDGHGLLEKARINQIAELQVDRVAAIGRVGKAAIYDVALVSQMKDAVSRMVPSASDLVQGMADVTALAMAEVVSQTGQQVQP